MPSAPSGDAIRRVAVVGTGFIGMGFALLFSRHGLEVRVYDESSEALGTLRDRVRSELSVFEDAGLLMGEARDSLLSRIEVADSLAQAVANAQYVQECVPEDLSIKRAAFQAMEEHAAPDAILASSASALGMSEIAANLRSPERCVVAHPTNPPHLLPLIEIVPGQRTNPAVVEAARSFLARVGQEPIVLRREIFGFVLNRLQFALEREAFYLLREGVASVQDIDRAVSEGLGPRWAFTGPFMVEELNATSVRDDLTKFSESIAEMVALLGPWEGPTAGDIDLVERGLAEEFRGRTRDGIYRWRAAGLLGLRAYKNSGS